MAREKTEMEILAEKLKYEVAEELGLRDKIDKVGWGGLTARESGRIGGLISVRKKKMKTKEK